MFFFFDGDFRLDDVIFSTTGCTAPAPHRKIRGRAFTIILSTILPLHSPADLDTSYLGISFLLLDGGHLVP